jgi:hypothetical protein
VYLKTFYRIVVLLLLFSKAHPIQAASPTRLASESYSNGYANPDSPEVIYVPGSANTDLQTAISQVGDGGIIEMGTGTYNTPSSGYEITDLTKSFTVRATPGADVILTGSNTHSILSIRNSPANLQSSIVFQGITFSNGFSSAANVGAGLTISDSNVTFIDCVFQDNVKTGYRYNTSGGAVYIKNGSTVFFFDSIVRNNSSEDGGAGIGVRDSKAYIHNTELRGNRTTANSVSSMPVGSGMSVVDSTLRITNSNFQGNESAGHGAGVYINGQWTTSGSDVEIANSTFTDNQIVRSVGTSTPIEGGAVNVENNTSLRIHNSRFITNSAQIGGGVNIFRAKVEIYNSVFQGNRATDTLPTSGFGGAINFNYYDRYNSAYLILEDSLIQGRYGSVTTVAQFGGGIHVGGMSSSTKPHVTIRRVVFNDLDLTPNSTKAGVGGALEVGGADLLVEDSFVLNCDARGPRGGIGGGVILYVGTVANFNRSVFAFNTADTFGGAIFAQGAQINISDSVFYKNEMSPGVNETEQVSFGAAIFASPDTSQGAQASGTIANSKFISNVGVTIFDDDRSSGAYNAVVYNNNQFYQTAYNGMVYKNSLTASQTSEGLNSLVVAHSGFSTDKSPLGGNQTLTSAPLIARLLAVPTAILPTLAFGELGTTTSSYMGFLWNGNSGQLDGVTLTSNAGVQATSNPGQHILSVDSTNVNVQVSQGPAPALQTSILPGSPNPNMNWALTGGTFRYIQADMGLNIPNIPSGSTQLPSGDRIYSVYTSTKEGGVVQFVDPRIPVLSLPDKVTILIGLNQADRTGAVPISNLGGQILAWTAQNNTPNLIELQASSGSITTYGSIPYLVKVNQIGQYQANMSVDAGTAGAGQVIIEIIVVAFIQNSFLPVTIR